MSCECVSKSWWISYSLMQSYDTNGYLTRIQQVSYFNSLKKNLNY